MLQALINVFRIPELRNKLLFTIAMLAVYRIGYWIPVPGVDQTELQRWAQAQVAGDATGVGRMLQFVQVFSGGSFSQSTIFGLGIMPYISAGIIFQLLASAYEPLKKLQQEGPTGRQKIMEWTRYVTVGLCIIQGLGWLTFISRGNLVYPNWANNPLWWVMALTAMTAGCVFLMWLGEQIDKYGIGNGVSVIIAAGILAHMPNALFYVVQNSPMREWGWVASMFGLDAGEPQISWMGVISIVAAFVFVVAGCVIITVAQRRIPIQQAKHTRGRKVYGGQRSYLPLRVNHGGVMPIIFASSLMMIPSAVFGMLKTATDATGGWTNGVATFLADNLVVGQYPYELLYILMIFFFSYFWTTVQFNPEEMSKQLRDHGSFIPGLRPGPRTEEYLETVMERITYVGAAFLSILAVVPTMANTALGIDWSVSQFLGGTGLLIVVSVALDIVQRLEANLLMRNYAGFLGGDDGKGPRIRGPRAS
ncbi:MAG: preprotein translocase subunit SecY [Planctomycetota bacterium]|nr:preprotein translocase subunit SecY [Planctomycetota bacterium]